MATKAERAQRLRERLRELHVETSQTQCDLAELKRQMGHPPDDQIERAVEMGKDIRGGCTCDP